MKGDWFVNPKTNEEVTFVDFARSEGRFAKHFDKDGNPSETVLMKAKCRIWLEVEVAQELPPEVAADNVLRLAVHLPT